jgi:hypothetical protein
MKKWRVVSNADAVIQVITRGDHALLTSVELARAREAWLWHPLSESLIVGFAASAANIIPASTKAPLFHYALPISLGERLFMSGYALIDILLEATLKYLR